jgi:hypothetical protein
MTADSFPHQPRPFANTCKQRGVSSKLDEPRGGAIEHVDVDARDGAEAATRCVFKSLSF